MSQYDHSVIAESLLALRARPFSLSDSKLKWDFKSLYPKQVVGFAALFVGPMMIVALCFSVVGVFHISGC